MSLLLAPYNDSMRLGMGYNSYIQTMCIDKAVEVGKQDQTPRTANPSQVVTYSSKFVTHLSDIVKSMNISYSSSIQKGSVEVAGTGNFLDEDKIKESDTNAIVSVKVVNQTTIIDDTCTFNSIQGVNPGSTAFNDAFGDTYISGYIEGGDFLGIVSIKVVDRTKMEETIATIKKGFSAGGATDQFTLDPQTFGRTSTNVDFLQDTETTIFVSFMGGGQIKPADMTWDIKSVYAAAAAFPANVARCPQKTWAILTKYKANRSYVQWAGNNSLSPLEYDLVTGFTTELFDNYMEYKQLLKLVQDMIANPNDYKARTWKLNSIPLVTSTLLCVKNTFRYEMGKIVQAVSVLAKNPMALQQIAARGTYPTDPLVARIMRDALGETSPAVTTNPPPSNAAASAAGRVYPRSLLCVLVLLVTIHRPLATRCAPIQLVRLLRLLPLTRLLPPLLLLLLHLILEMRQRCLPIRQNSQLLSVVLRVLAMWTYPFLLSISQHLSHPRYGQICCLLL
jgi:hypothetical protein